MTFLENQIINIYNLLEEGWKTLRYWNIKAWVINWWQSFSQLTAENNPVEITYVCINKKYKYVYSGDIVEYIDFKWQLILLKVENTDLIDVKSWEKFIELKCKKS